MAIKINNSTIIDNNRNIVNAGVITATSFSGDGSGLTGVGVGASDSINTTGIITAFAVSANEFVGTGDKLIFSPTITSFSPTDGNTSVAAISSPNIVLTYDQPIYTGVGTITLRKNSSTGTIVESFEIGVSNRATISNQTLTINPTSDFDYTQEYYVVIPQGSIKNALAVGSGILTTYNFTAEPGPTLSSAVPADEATNVGVSTNITFTFNKNIRRGTGTITLRKNSSTGTIVESYDATSSARLTFSTNTLTIDPTSDLDYSNVYYVVIPNGAIDGYAGISTYNFTSEPGPTLSSAVPADEATNVGLSTNITFTFNKNIRAGTGTITLRSGTADGTIIESYDVTSSARLTFSTNTLTIDPTSDFNYNTVHYVVIPNGAIDGYAGISTYNFTSIPLSLGDSFGGGRLICQSSGVRWVVAPSSTEIGADWNNSFAVVTCAQQVTGCTGWFLPDLNQLLNPGYVCKSYWDVVPTGVYWTSSERSGIQAWYVNMSTGGATYDWKSDVRGARAFRCVTY